MRVYGLRAASCRRRTRHPRKMRTGTHNGSKWRTRETPLKEISRVLGQKDLGAAAKMRKAGKTKAKAPKTNEGMRDYLQIPNDRLLLHHQNGLHPSLSRQTETLHHH